MPTRKRKQRNTVFKKQKGLCHYCGKKMLLITNQEARAVKRLSEMMTLDHVVMKCKGGTFGLCNLVGACHECNILRGDVPYKLFIRWYNSRYGIEHIEAWKRKREDHHNQIARLQRYRAGAYI